TGIHSQFQDLTAKRLELFKALVPNMKRDATFYNPANPVVMKTLAGARDASRRLNVELVARKVASPDELRTSLAALKPAEAEAIFTAGDGMVISQTPVVVAAANAKKLPVMTSESTSISSGALASYGVSYYTCGRLAAKYVVRVLNGANP